MGNREWERGAGSRESGAGNWDRGVQPLLRLPATGYRLTSPLPLLLRLGDAPLEVMDVLAAELEAAIGEDALL